MDNDHEPVDILIVEDEPNDVELTVRALRKGNITNHIHVATNGQEALDYFFANQEGSGVARTAKVVLLDLKLPLVNGIEVLRRLRADDRTRMVPVVALTSSREERDIQETYDLGVNSYIVKPVNFAQFRQAIQSLGLYWLVLNRAPQRLDPSSTSRMEVPSG